MVVAHTLMLVVAHLILLVLAHIMEHNFNNIYHQRCDETRHTTKTFVYNKNHSSNGPMANHTTTSSLPSPSWLIDSATSHHITSNLKNLSIQFDYSGTNEIVIGDGTGLLITHIGSIYLKNPSTSFSL